MFVVIKYVTASESSVSTFSPSMPDAGSAIYIALMLVNGWPSTSIADAKLERLCLVLVSRDAEDSQLLCFSLRHVTFGHRGNLSGLPWLLAVSIRASTRWGGWILSTVVAVVIVAAFVDFLV